MDWFKLYNLNTRIAELWQVGTRKLYLKYLSIVDKAEQLS